MKQSLSAADVAALVPMSPGVLDRLSAHLDLLKQWQRKINLVGSATLADPWRRHVLDSAQIVQHLPTTALTIVDLGSGAGYPGLVVAIMTGHPIHLIDSDVRKCAFLREAARITETAIVVHASRIEALPSLGADLITSRACAPLVRLLGYAERHLAANGRCVFLKGRDLDAELTESSKSWMMRNRRTPSLTDPSATVLQLEAIRRRDDSRSR